MILDLQAMLQASGGVMAIEDEPVRQGVIRPGPKLWVEVTRVSLHGGAVAQVPPTASPPILRFVVFDEDHRPLHSFAMDRELAIEALQHAHPSHLGLSGPAPAFVDEAVGENEIRPGAKRFLSMSMVSLADTPARSLDSGAGVRFEVADQHLDPLYSFTIDWPLAFLVINLAYPDHEGQPREGEG